jgi:hypothetical protein
MRFWTEVKAFICANEPTAMHRFLIDVAEGFVIIFLVVAVIKMTYNLKKVKEQIKRYHPND